MYEQVYVFGYLYTVVTIVQLLPCEELARELVFCFSVFIFCVVFFQNAV